jgi:sortase A
LKDRRPIDELTIDELEEVLRIRRREARLERLRQMGKDTNGGAFDPLAPKPAIEPQAHTLPTGHRRFQDTGAIAQFRARTVEEIAEPDKPTREPFQIRWKWLRDKSLLVVELGVLAALILVLANIWMLMQQLNQEADRAQQQQVEELPSPTPTPLIRVALLPGGHTPPDELGRSSPEQVPAHLRHIVSDITPMPIPTEGPERATLIEIPSIKVKAPVVEGDDWESLKQGAGHHVGSANPGESDNCIISAHNDIYGEIFRDLPEVSLDDEVFIHSANGQVFRYVVTQKRIIDPEEVSVMHPTSSPVLTLISCYPYGIDSHRIVVVAELW